MSRTMIDRFKFGAALEVLRQGLRVRRTGWNGKGMWLVLVVAESYAVSIGRPQQAMYGKAFTGHDESHFLAPWIGMKTADDKFVPWLASQTDLLAEDWELAE